MDTSRINQAAHVLGLGAPGSLRSIYRGDWAEVYRLETDRGLDIAVKCPARGHEWLAVEEARMLEFLGNCKAAAVPEVLGLEDGMLFLRYIVNDGRKTTLAEREAGQYLAQLHAVNNERFGFDSDTIFGPLAQPNPWTDDWVQFFGQRRLLQMGKITLDAGRMGGSTMARLERLIGRLDEFIAPADKASLVHGDFWGGNVLFNQGRCAAFIDPAIYFGHPEVDLAFATLFASFGQPFFEGYGEIHRIEPGFRSRIDIYNLWPLLFHACWFGGGYLRQVESILAARGF